jgi:uracil-DNA glycosylase family 4
LQKLSFLQFAFGQGSTEKAKIILPCICGGAVQSDMSSTPRPNPNSAAGSPAAGHGLPVANPGPLPARPTPLVLFNQDVIQCQRCTRLRKYCEEIATSKRRAYRDWVYWAKPVPSFGDEQARLFVLGLAPGAHGSNRTGRPFTGDGSGDFLYPVLHEAGFASQPNSVSRGDGMKLQDCWISSVVRCAPPDNTPKRSELINCASHLDVEIKLLTNLRVVVCLGRIAFDGYLEHMERTGQCERKPRFKFSHGAEYALPGERYLVASYHPSLQNTNTGKLTRGMFFKVFERARVLADSADTARTLRR